MSGIIEWFFKSNIAYKYLSILTPYVINKINLYIIFYNNHIKLTLLITE